MNKEHPQDQYAGILYPQEDYEAYIEEQIMYEEEVHTIISTFKDKIESI